MTENFIRVELGTRSYDIVLGNNILQNASELLDIDRRCLIVTDSGVPEEYSGIIADSCLKPVSATLRQGEGSKSLEALSDLLRIMMNNGFTRSDCVIAVGGGMTGDIAGLAAAMYMRGIDFYNIPTTVLSQADSSIGGKTAVNIDSIKNIAGAFWQPRRVLIDTATLDTLPCREYVSGLAEVIKSGLIADAELFGYFEETAVKAGEDESVPLEDKLKSIDIEYVIRASLLVKKSVVEEDEREGGMRRILNFGHTIGHGIESVTGMLHGECVAIGMLPMCSPDVRSRLIKVLDYFELPTCTDASPYEILAAAHHDKKTSGNKVTAVFVDEPGSCRISGIDNDELKERIRMICRTDSEASTERE